MANLAQAADGVDTAHAAYTQARGKWQRVRDAVSGEDAVHAATVRYLPKLKKEPLADYKARIDRTSWYNATWRTVSGLHGMIFRKEPVVTVPTAVESYLEDVTFTGVDFHGFAREVAYEALTVSFLGILVDHPPAPDTQGRPLTVAMAEELGLRPTMALYKAEAILNWGFRRIRNKWTLSQVRLFECVTEPDTNSEFKTVNVDQIRVLDLNIEAGDTYRQRVFRKNKDTGKWAQYGNDVVPLMDSKPLPFIPFTFVTPNGVTAEVDDPALIDLVDLNVKHYQVTADYEHACHFTALPTPWVAGVPAEVNERTGEKKPREIHIGTTQALVFENAEAKCGYMEFAGSGIDALEKNLTRKEAQMAAIGARMLAPEKKGVEAGETLAIRHSGENSVLATIAISCSQGLTQALRWFAQWAGAGEEAECKLNRDFLPVPMDPATLQAYMAAWQSGALSEPEFYELLQRGDLIRADKPLDEHQGEVDANPPMGMLVAQAGIDALGEDDEEDPKDKKKAA